MTSVRPNTASKDRQTDTQGQLTRITEPRWFLAGAWLKQANAAANVSLMVNRASGLSGTVSGIKAI